MCVFPTEVAIKSYQAASSYPAIYTGIFYGFCVHFQNMYFFRISAISHSVRVGYKKRLQRNLRQNLSSLRFSITLQPYTSPRCTCPGKDTTENATFQKSRLPNDKCNFKFNTLIYSQKYDLFTYFEKRRRILHNGAALSKL